MALFSNGASCSTSISHALHPCSAALDGIANTSSTTFKFDFTGDPVGEWFKIEFNNQYTLRFMRIMESRFSSEKNLKDLELEFSDGSTQQVMQSVYVMRLNCIVILLMLVTKCLNKFLLQYLIIN